MPSETMQPQTALQPATQAIDRLTSRRQEFESRLGDLRLALDRELGWAPAARTWLVPLTAFAAGAALAAWLAGRRKRE